MSTTQPHHDLIRRALTHPAIVLVNLLARSEGVDLYLVGGAVRDLLLTDNLPLDLDFTLTTPLGSNVSAESFSKLAAERLDGRYVLLDEAFGIHRVVIQKENTSEDSEPLTLDIADALGNDLERDLCRRDLTVNSMAIGLDGQFYDPFSGVDDLKSKTIRMINEANLVEDSLRMLRVFRFMAQINAKKIDPATLQVVKTHGAKLLESAAERIHYEFLRMLTYPHSFPALKAMGDSGLLEVILPELIETRKIPPNGHHHLMLYDHTLELVNQSERLFRELSENAQADLSLKITPFCSRMAVVKLACLLHDIGKPATMDIREDGRHTFYGHDKESEEMTTVIGKRWKLSRGIIGRTQKLVRWHLYPCQFGMDSPRKSVLRFLRRMDDETPDVILLALADRHSTLGPEITDEILKKSTADHLWLLEQYYEESEVLKLPPLLNGKEVMALLELSPGPDIGKAIEALKEVHQLGDVSTADEAKVWLLENFKN